MVPHRFPSEAYRRLQEVVPGKRADPNPHRLPGLLRFFDRARRLPGGQKDPSLGGRQGPKAGEPALEECIPGLIRDLSFKIAFDLVLADPNKGVSAKTWRGFMHFTEALEAYYNYTQTGKARDLREPRGAASGQCIQKKNTTRP